MGLVFILCSGILGVYYSFNYKKYSDSTVGIKQEVYEQLIEGIKLPKFVSAVLTDSSNIVVCIISMLFLMLVGVLVDS